MSEQSGGAPPAGGPSPAEIRERRFSVTRKGFDQGEVVGFLAGVGAEVERLRASVTDLEAKVADARRAAATPAPLDEETVVATVGEEMATILRSAHAAASDLRRRAAEEAERTVSGARSKIEEDLAEAERRREEAAEEADRRLQAASTEAARLLAEATADAQRHLSEARAEAERLVADATVQAETAASRVRQAATEEGAQVVARARVEAEVVRQQAEVDRRSAIETSQALRERILSDLGRRRRTATVQIEQLLAGRERLLDAYAHVRETLDEVTTDLERADVEARAAADEVGRRHGVALGVATGDDDAGEDGSGEEDLTAALGAGPATVTTSDDSTDDIAGADDAPTADSPDAPTGPTAATDSPDPASSTDRPAAAGDGPAPADGPAAPSDGSGEPVTAETPAVDPDADPVLDLRTTSPAEGARRRAARADRTGGLFARLRSGLADDDSDRDEGDAATDDQLDATAEPVPEAVPAGPEPTGAGPAAGAGRARSGVRVIGVERAAAPAGAAASSGPEPSGVPAAGATSSGPQLVEAEPVEREPVGAAVDTEPTPAASVPGADNGPGERPGPAGGTAAARTPATTTSRRTRVPGNRSAAGAPASSGTRRPPSKPSSKAARSEGRDAPVAPAPGAVAAEVAPSDPSGDDDGPDGSGVPRSDEDEVRLQRRESALADIEVGLGRKLKRLLQDEHNDLLDRLRAANGHATPADALPALDAVVSTWVAAAIPLLAAAASAGAAFAGSELSLPDPAGPGDAAVTEVAGTMVRAIVEPTSRRLAALLAEPVDGGWEQLAETVGAVYRNARSQRVDAAVADTVAATFALGTWHATPEGTMLRWVAEDAGGPCPDCDDDALAGAQPKGEAFPTGQLHPPAHDGCHCLLVPEPA